MNSGMIFVIALVSIVMCAHVVTTYLKQKDKKNDNQEEIDEYLAKIEKLEERVKVLERIVTENRYDLKKEIDSLR